MATVTADARTGRIITLDVVRGFAVMGILAMNIVAFAMPQQAYMNPLVYGIEGAKDLAAYAFNFVLVDGKMRGLFSFLFGASMLLVIQQTQAKGESAASITFRRQLWLLVFGLVHFYLIWWGDILIGYALIGMLAWFFRNRSPRTLVAWGIGLLTLQFVIMAGAAFYAHTVAAALAANPGDPELLKQWEYMARDVAVPEPDRMREIFSLYLGPWSGFVHHQVTENLFMPLIFTLAFLWETLAYMLFGMAALKTGFLTGEWSDRRYTRVVAIGFGISIPVYAALALLLFRDYFTVPSIMAYAIAATVPIRPVMIVALAAWIILLSRDFGWLDRRIAAAGRAAFTNYIGTSILMTGLFYGWGLGQFGAFSRAELWLVVITMWVVMLAWSKPWLDRFTYGPFEWAWRSLSRWRVQPMRKQSDMGVVSA